VKVTVNFGGTRHVMPALARPNIVECAVIDMPQLGQGVIQLNACRPGYDVGCR